MGDKIKLEMDPKLQDKLSQNAYSKNLDNKKTILDQAQKQSAKLNASTIQQKKDNSSTKTNAIYQKNNSIQSDAEIKNPISDKIKGQTTSSQQCSVVAQNGQKCPFKKRPQKDIQLLSSLIFHF